MSKYSKLRALAWQEKFLLARFIFCILWVSFSIRFFGYLRTRRFEYGFISEEKLHQANDIEFARAERAAELIAIAGRHGFITATCLPQSVFLEYWLKRQNLAAEIKIGVRKADDLFDAHAWVELNGIALAQDDLEHHRVLQ
jgi:hypothetical protein